jgi:ribonuclease-3
VIEELEKKINYHFRNKDILGNALIHKSYNEGVKKETINNEKLEFLGDSVINLIVTDLLFKRFKKSDEGDLSKVKSHLVSTNFLFEIADSINLKDHVLLGKGEEKNGGRENRKIISSLFEAVVGAIYLDSNFKVVSTVIAPFYKDFLETLVEKEVKINDYKSELQEILQRHRNILPLYEILEESGKSPHMNFTAAVYISKREIGRGHGRSKRQAEQNAALNALEKIEDFINYEKLSEVFFLKND